jgi:serine/threonine protein kinase
MEICELVKDLNSKGLSHNDLKLNNIVIRDDFSLALIDFAHCSYKEQYLRPGPLGTSIFRAPEMNIPRYHNTIFRADQAEMFALAACFFVLISLALPFGTEDEGGATKENVYYRHFFEADGLGYKKFFK